MRRVLLLAIVALAWPCAHAEADEPWAHDAEYRALLVREAKVLRGLLQAARKKDYRRQVGYLAQRILQVDPTDGTAAGVANAYDAEQLQLGQVPRKAFLKRRDGALRQLGDDYVQLAERLEASGLTREACARLWRRAYAYGSRSGALRTALEEADLVWLGVYGVQAREKVERLLGASHLRFRFPQEHEDEYLAARCVWPAARGARSGPWRLLTDHECEEALRLLGMLASAEAWLVENLGSSARHDAGQVTDVLVFREWQTYDTIGEDIVHARDRERFVGTSGWYDLWGRRLLVCWHHRDNAFLGDDDLMLGHAAKVMARHHLGAGAGGRVQGKGYALLEGLRGAFEGFERDAEGRGRIVPSACWRLAAARTLREQNMLMPWEDLLDLDQKAGEALARPSLTISFGGTPREAKRVDRIAAQATALVVGILQADGGKLNKRFAKLVGDLYKRDSLPDLAKALGRKKGKIFELAEGALDAAGGRAAK